MLAGVLAAVRRISPLAAGLPGALLLAWMALYLVSVKQAVALIPLRTHAFGAGWEEPQTNGILGLAGVVLVFPLFIPSRWSRPARAVAGRAARQADDYLTEVWPDSAPRQAAAPSRPNGSLLTPTRPPPSRPAGNAKPRKPDGTGSRRPGDGRLRPPGGHHPDHRRLAGAAPDRVVPRLHRLGPPRHRLLL